MNPGSFEGRMQTKRDTAKVRQEARATLTPQQQLEALDRKLGKDIGSTKERIRLHNLIAQQEVEKKKPKKPVDLIKEGLQDAIAYSKGDKSKGKVWTKEK